MGATDSKPYYGITQEMLSEFMELTYLSRNEILSLAKTFGLMNSGIPDITKIRVPFENIARCFPQLEHNPFRDQLCKIFSSEKDGCYSFEDLLDLCSVMSENCPVEVKATWAFRLFDFNDDQAVDMSDLKIVIDRITMGFPETIDSDSKSRYIDEELKEHIINILLKEIDIDSTGSISQLEYEHGISKISEFAHSFSFRS